MAPPAARIGDMHTCPMVNPGPVPHVGGPILPPCAVTVITGGRPQARVSDMAVCVGPPDVIVKGSATVIVSGMPAARLGDSTAHGGVIVVGFPTVLIGDAGGGGGGKGAAGAGLEGGGSFVQPAVQAKALIAAAKDGTPFCERCNAMAASAALNAKAIASKPTPSPAAKQAAAPHSLGDLSARYESRGDPGTVSSGRGDPGGISYGTYQYATNTGDAALFVGSKEAKPWASDFQNLTPGTTAFGDQWRTVAARDPQAFAAAQHSYMQRSHYDPVVSRVQQATGYDINGGSDAVRDAAWSASVQHGRASMILGDAVARTDKVLKRGDAEYEQALINNIYDRRTEYVEGLRDRAVAEGRIANAQTFSSIVENRYPAERADALRLLNRRN
jgi:uncharacterized Zn-binding protein involved in type VI secretion